MNKAYDSKSAGHNGFTLIEVLLAMLITSILILGVNTMYRQAYMIWSSAENLRPVYHTCRLITETLRQELSCLYFPPAGQDDGPRFELICQPNEKTEFAFYTLTPAWRADLESSRIARILYRFTRNPDTQETVLERFEQPCAGETPIGKETPDLVLKGMADLAVWVVDPNSEPGPDAWRQSYSSKDVPPKAVRVLMKWQATDKAPEVTFECCSFIPCDSPAL